MSSNLITVNWSKTNKKHKVEINSLINESAKLSDRDTKEATKRNSLEEYSRRQNLEIAGVLVTNGEDTTNLIVTEIAGLLNAKLTAGDIWTSHRLQTKNKFKPSIIFCVISRGVRNK